MKSRNPIRTLLLRTPPTQGLDHVDLRFDRSLTYTHNDPATI